MHEISAPQDEQNGPKSPRQPTVKRLFAVSGNQCAYGNCRTQVVDRETGSITAEIAHIKAQSEGGPRYDPAQTLEERHAFENLILLCGHHHKVIDDDEVVFTVEVLQKMKADHEVKMGTQAEPVDAGDIATRLIANFVIASHTEVSHNVVNQGSIVTTVNQLGGQAAHQIFNHGVQPRRLSIAVASYFVTELKRFQPKSIDVLCLMGDGEGYHLAQSIMGMLRQAGWTCNGISQAVFTGAVPPILLKVPAGMESDQSMLALLNLLAQAGLRPEGVALQDQTKAELIVGPNI